LQHRITNETRGRMTPTMQAMSDFRSGAGDDTPPSSFSEIEKVQYKDELIKLIEAEFFRDMAELSGGV